MLSTVLTAPGYVLSKAVTTTAAAAALIGSVSTRGLAVLTWGRNVEGQCGVESSLLVLRPTPVIELHDAALVGITAGKLNSGAVTAHGEAWTWGDGQGGKLGHGTVLPVHAPHRVESLVGRADIRQVALGDHHTLFVDGVGGLWACGENKEGQCGLGTPLEVIASQHRRAYHESMKPLPGAPMTAEPQASRQQRAKKALHALMGAAEGAQHAQHAYGSGHGGHHTQWAASRASGWQSLAAAGGSTGSSGVTASGARTALNFSGMDFESAFAASGIQPGQQATPLRIGRDQHPLWEAVTGGQGEPEGGAMRVVLSRGLESEVVVGVAASRYFSAALTAAGDVWTFGACYNGSLGSNQSWSTSAQKVSGSLAAALNDEGGARQLVTGGSFCAALTAGGKVVVWGRIPGSEGSTTLGDVEAAAGGGCGGAALGITEQGVGIVQGGRVIAGMIPGLPPLTHIAAGQQHLLMSDGQHVWVVGRTLDGSGSVASSVPWRRPQLLLTLPSGDSVKQLVAGVHSSGVVTENGDAWMWGRLLDRHHADSVARRHPNLAYGGGDGVVASGFGGAMAPLLKDDVRWDWAGFGAREPTRMEDLGGRVQSLALGGWHAMAVVE